MGDPALLNGNVLYGITHKATADGLIHLAVGFRRAEGETLRKLRLLCGAPRHPGAVTPPDAHPTCLRCLTWYPGRP